MCLFFNLPPPPATKKQFFNAYAASNQNLEEFD